MRRSARIGVATALLALAFGALGSGGCPGIPRPLEAPQVELRAAALEGGALAAELSVANPNQVGLVVEAVDWELAVDDRTVARGRMEQHTEVAALSATSVSLRGLLSAGQAERVAGVAGGDVTLAGTLHLRAPRGPVAASFFGPLERAATASVSLRPASSAAR